MWRVAAFLRPDPRFFSKTVAVSPEQPDPQQHGITLTGGAFCIDCEVFTKICCMRAAAGNAHIIKKCLIPPDASKIIICAF